jgi:hypothetical protein
MAITISGSGITSSEILDGTITNADTDGSIGATHTSSGTAPSSPSIGDKWHDTTNEKLYMRTNDGTSNLWLQI